MSDEFQEQSTAVMLMTYGARRGGVWVWSCEQWVAAVHERLAEAVSEVAVKVSNKPQLELTPLFVHAKTAQCRVTHCRESEWIV